MLKVQIKKQLGDFRLDISFEQEAGYLGMLGASGSGKSMTLKCIAGIETPDEGSIILNDRVLFDSEKKINLTPRQRKVGYLFQNYALFPNMTVEENIGVGIRGGRKWNLFYMAGKKAVENKVQRRNCTMGEQGGRLEKRQAVAGLIQQFQLQSLEKHYPAQLSGGQQQRVAMARMMAVRPELILLDEPFSALDGYLKEKLQRELMLLLKDYAGDVLLVSHSRHDIYRFCPNVLAIDDGQVLQTGTLNDIFFTPINNKVARLTGCNNISPAAKTGAYEVYAIDWDIHLTTAVPVAEDIHYVGIRSHDIRVADIENNENGENIYQMELLDLVESPFEYKYHMKATSKNAKEAIWWKTYKDLNPNATPESFPQKIQLPKEKLLLLKE